MKQAPSITTAIPAPWYRRLFNTLLLSVATLGLLYAPDVMLETLHGLGKGAHNRPYFPAFFLMSLLITLTANRYVLNGVLSVFFVLQLVWIGALKYFGDALKPEQILLSFDQGYEVYGSLLTETYIFITPAIIVLSCYAALFFLHNKIPAHRLVRLPFVSIVLLIAVAAAFARPIVRNDYFYNYPTQRLPSLYGAMTTTMLTARISYENAALEANASAHPPRVFSALPLAHEKSLVVVIMGESISSEQMGLYGAKRDTTPQLDLWARGTHENIQNGFKLFVNRGFSMGTSTFASVPHFLRMDANPRIALQTQGKMQNIFDVARTGDFNLHYLSVQKQGVLNIAGGMGKTRPITSEETHTEIVDRIQDDLLVDELKKMTFGHERDFLFIHQRVNHGSYTDNCKHVPDINRFSIEETSGPQNRINKYDDGILCYDRNLDHLLTELAKNTVPTYVFITADHNEMMGVDGLWGHSINKLRTSLVPYMLFTNQPDSETAREFNALQLPSATQVSSLLARTMGMRIDYPDVGEGQFFINGAVAFGRAGYLEVTRTQDPLIFDVIHRTIDDQIAKRETEMMPPFKNPY